jgi:L,D-peptidoglycan transpeptidase YkuD (ErfK/YbiS/YcfS/YnhG family)
MNAQDNTIYIQNETLVFLGKTYACAIGKAGFSVDKKEGDNCTPVGTFSLREVWYRADKMPPPKTELPLRIITQNDGWCDDVSHTDYNIHVTLPHPARHEKLWRDDNLYDVVVVIGYNDSPPLAGKGSAIFMHIAKPNYEGTEGCIALAQQDLLDIVSFLSINTRIKLQN